MWESVQFLITMWVLGVELRSSGLAASLLKQAKKKYGQILVAESNKNITKTKLKPVPLMNLHEKNSDASRTNSTAYSEGSSL